MARKDAADAVIAAALANDPDVKMARAKIQLAEAELAKARQAVTLRVVTLRAKIASHRTEVATAQDSVALITRQVQAGTTPTSELLSPRTKLEAAQAAQALAEAELKLLTGGTGVAVADPTADKVGRVWGGWDDLANAEDASKVARLLEYHRAVLLQERAAVKGPIPDRIRAALDKPVRLGAKGEKVTFPQALEAFKKEAGLDVPVRGTDAFVSILSQGEELPVGAWFQLFQDTYDGAFYVREYGLRFATKQSAPPDAPTLTDFWKQRPPAKEPAPKK